MFEDPRSSATSSSFGELYQKKECILIANRINENSEEPFQKNGKKKKEKEKKKKKQLGNRGHCLSYVSGLCGQEAQLVTWMLDA